MKPDAWQFRFLLAVAISTAGCQAANMVSVWEEEGGVSWTAT